MHFVIVGVDTGGYARGLLKGSQDLGYQSTFIEVAPHFDESGRHEPNVNKIFRKSGSNVIVRFLSSWVWYFKRARAVARVKWRGSVVIANSGISLLPFALDLIWARILGATVVVLSGHGTDSRLPHASPHGPEGSRTGIVIAFKTLTTWFRLRYLARVANFFFCSPMTGNLAPKPFLNQLDLGHPLILDKYDALNRQLKGKSYPLRVLHAPSSQLTKGSEDIRRRLTHLEKQGLITFREETFKNHKDLLCAISESDVLLDQLYADNSSSVIAAEAMKLGRVAAIGGYFVDFKSPYSGERPPTVAFHPDNLEATLCRLALMTNGEFLSLCAEGQNFVNQHFDSRRVTDVLVSWLLNKPLTQVSSCEATSYTLGAGVPRDEVNRKAQLPLVKLALRLLRVA